jgi:hypothetical protein
MERQLLTLGGQIQHLDLAYSNQSEKDSGIASFGYNTLARQWKRTIWNVISSIASHRQIMTFIQRLQETQIGSALLLAVHGATKLTRKISRREDLNLQPRVYKTRALPIELRRQKLIASILLLKTKIDSAYQKSK